MITDFLQKNTYKLLEAAVENLAEMLTFANAAASIITPRKGALRVMPEEKEIKLLI